MIRIVPLIETYVLVYYMSHFGMVLQILRPPDQGQPGITQNASYIHESRDHSRPTHLPRPESAYDRVPIVRAPSRHALPCPPSEALELD